MSGGDTARTAAYLAVPLLLAVKPVRTAHGWEIEAAYPEFDGCTVRCDRLTDAMDQLERRRLDLTVALLDAGELPPAPRDPLPYLAVAANDALTARAAAGAATAGRAVLRDDAPRTNGGDQ
jgi:hypothetical protein